MTLTEFMVLLQVSLPEGLIFEQKESKNRSYISVLSSGRSRGVSLEVSDVLATADESTVQAGANIVVKVFQKIGVL